MRSTLILVATTLLSDWAAASERADVPTPRATLEVMPNPDGCGPYSRKMGKWCVCLTGFKMNIHPLSEEPEGGYDSRYHYTARKYMNCVIDRDYLNSYMTEYCAPESGTCSCKGTVLYGDFGDIGATTDVAELVLAKPAALRTVDGSIQCSAAEFRDPLPGKTKHCLCVSAEKRCDENATQGNTEDGWDYELRQTVDHTKCHCKPGYAVARDVEHKTRKYLPDTTYRFTEIGKEGYTCMRKRPLKPCMDEAALQQCQAWGKYSKERNGCLAFAKGWKKQKNECHSCGETTRDYGSCYLPECMRLCKDMYNPRVSSAVKSAWKLCNSGCRKAFEFADLYTPSPPAPAPTPIAQISTQYDSSCIRAEVLQQCQTWGRTTKERNGCLGFAKGWKEQANECHSCGATHREYDPCSKSECTAMCADMYANARDSERERCLNGCSKYAELLADANTAAATPPRYVLGEQGADDCPDGYAPIPTYEECETAALELDAGYSPRYIEDWYPQPVPGCSLDKWLEYAFHTDDCKYCSSDKYKNLWMDKKQAAEMEHASTPVCKLSEEPAMRGATRRLQQDIARRLLGSEGDDASH